MDSEVLAVRRETHDTVTVQLSAPFSIIPGQFVMLSTSIEGKLVKRSYSVSGYGKGFIEVTVKEQPSGIMSTYCQHLKPKDAIQLLGPFGHFNLQTAQEQELVFIAAGSGIAPFRAALLAGAKATLIYSAKNNADIIFNKELLAWHKQGLLRLVVTLTRPTEDELKTHVGPFGRVNHRLLSQTFPQGLENKLFCICGATPFVVDVVQILKTAGVPSEHIRTEKFGLAA